MKRRIKHFCIITLVLLIVSIWTLIYFIPVAPPLADVSFSQAVYDEHKQLLRMTLSQDGKYRLFTPLEKMAPQLIAATLLQEDQYFYWHIGINPVATLKALWQTYALKTRRVGASTVTMQVARLQYKINSKTFLGKIKQMFRALQLEAHFSKHDILEAYLNLAPYGNNVEGVGAASLLYFKQEAAALKLPEILTLVVIPQNPNKRVPKNGALKLIRNKFFLRWIKEYPADKKIQPLMALPLQLQAVRSAPFVAPHFVNDVLKNFPFNQGQINTTLDISLQNIIQHQMRQYLQRKNKFAVYNAAIMLIDSRDMSVKALIGSADFFNRNIDGQINGTKIKRSPGSTLKPFIYALALDQGLIHPATVLKDVPRSFGSYNPENFDYDFVGPISAQDALVLSRNIPAVNLADQLHKPSLYQFLQQAHITFPKNEAYYGLALVLGGAEVSMQELIQLYAMLANGGLWQPLSLVKSKENIKPQRLLSREASYLVLDMLKATQRSQLQYGVSKDQLPEIAWKTGTSSGYRDAWTIGVVGPYVLAVWIGNFNNQGNQAFIGKEIAAPLFFDIVHALRPQLNFLAPTSSAKTLNLTHIDVCKASGMLPTRYCTDVKKTWFIPGKSPIKSDNIYREIAINKKTGLRACHFDQDTTFVVYEFWPSDLLQIFKRAGIARRTPPVYDKSCTLRMKKTEGWSPQIISPQASTKYILRLESIHKNTIPLLAVVDADVTTIYWFVNETYLGKAARDQSFYWHAQPGQYIIRVVDDFGRSDARELKVNIE